jgi:hypothetical protein
MKKPLIYAGAALAAVAAFTIWRRSAALGAVRNDAAGPRLPAMPAMPSMPAMPGMPQMPSMGNMPNAPRFAPGAWA